jgi:hypothetical protein
MTLGKRELRLGRQSDQRPLQPVWVPRPLICRSSYENAVRLHGVFVTAIIDLKQRHINAGMA